MNDSRQRRREDLAAVAASIAEALGADLSGGGTVGFALLVFPLGAGGSCDYVTNDTAGRDAVSFMKALIARKEGDSRDAGKASQTVETTGKPAAKVRGPALRSTRSANLPRH